jgi:hypothetical protein
MERTRFAQVQTQRPPAMAAFVFLMFLPLLVLVALAEGCT